MRLAEESLEVLELFGLQRYREASFEKAPKPYREAIERWGFDRNLLFLGPVGVGKTSAMVLAMRTAYQRGYLPHWLRWSDFSIFKGEDLEELLGKVDVVDVVFIDDVGTELSGYSLQMAELFVTRVYDLSKPVVASLNVSKKTLEELRSGKAGPTFQRIFDRLRDRAIVAVYTGKSRRGGNGGTP